MADRPTLTLERGSEKGKSDMKKKLLALVLLVSLLGTVLSGCGDGSAEQESEDRATAGELVVGIAQD